MMCCEKILTRSIFGIPFKRSGTVSSQIQNRHEVQRENMSGHLCYFSKRCRFCQAFLEELSRSPFAKTLRLVCVDPSPSRPPLPAWLKVVPTLILQDGNALIGPTAVNNWLFEQRLLNGNSAPQPDPFKERTQAPSVPTYSPDMAPRASPAAKLPPAISSNTAAKSSQAPPALAGGATDGPEAWHSAEMAGGNWSDAYSFLSDTFTAEKGINPIHRNFELLQSGGVAGGSAGGSAGASGAAVKRTAKEEKLLSDFEAFTRKRDMEFSSSKRIG